MSLKPRAQRKARADPDHRPAAPQARASRARISSPGPRTSRSAADSAALPIPVHAAGRRSRRARYLGAEAGRQAASTASARRRYQRSAGQRRYRDPDHRSRPGVALRHPALADRRDDLRRIGQREVTQYFTQLNAYHVIMEVAPLAERPGLLDRLSHSAPCTASRCRCRASVARHDQDPISRSITQSQFPSVTVSFNLAGGAALGDAVTAVQQVEARSRCSGDADRVVPGHGAGLPVFAGDDALSDRRRTAGCLPDPRRALRKLHSPADHLSTLPSAGVGAL